MRLLSISFNYKKTINLGYIHSMGETYEEAIINGKTVMATQKGYINTPGFNLDHITVRSCNEISNDITNSTTFLSLPKSK